MQLFVSSVHQVCSYPAPLHSLIPSNSMRAGGMGWTKKWCSYDPFLSHLAYHGDKTTSTNFWAGGWNAEMWPLNESYSAVFHTVLLIWFADLTFESVEEIQRRDHSNETSSAVLLHGAIHLESNSSSLAHSRHDLGKNPNGICHFWPLLQASSERGYKSEVFLHKSGFGIQFQTCFKLKVEKSNLQH